MTLAQGHGHLHTKPWPPAVLWCLAHTSPLGTGRGRAVNPRGTGVSSSLPSCNLWSRLLFNTSVNKDQAKPLLSAAGRARAYRPRASHTMASSEGLGVPMACTWAKVPSASPTSFRGTSDGGAHLEELPTPCKDCLAQWGLPSKFTGLPMLLPVPVTLCLPLFEVALGSDALFLPISLVPAHPGTRPLRGAWSAALAPGPASSLGALAPDIWATPPQDSLPGLPLQSSHCTGVLCAICGASYPRDAQQTSAVVVAMVGVSQEAITQGLLLSLPLPAS